MNACVHLFLDHFWWSIFILCRYSHCFCLGPEFFSAFPHVEQNCLMRGGYGKTQDCCCGGIILNLKCSPLPTQACPLWSWGEDGHSAWIIIYETRQQVTFLLGLNKMWENPVESLTRSSHFEISSTTNSDLTFPKLRQHVRPSAGGWLTERNHLIDEKCSKAKIMWTKTTWGSEHKAEYARPWSRISQEERLNEICNLSAVLGHLGDKMHQHHLW